LTVKAFRAVARQLRDLYEQTAMMGTFVALAHKPEQQNPQSPEAAAATRVSA
jgi:hypothetical protein